ncbi:MAG TPA: hypothetical protein PKM78_09825 [Anaerolineae bacterium]|nr:hypothetical protein [Anaerolineae bacterium]HNU04316.1 hypothetical protein [Anaerolineae bacterium]
MTEKTDNQRALGRVLRSSTASFTAGCRTLEDDLPVFGALVQAERRDGAAVYGLIYDVRVDDDPFVRQLIAAGDLSEEYVQDQRQRRQVPVEVNVLVVGGRDRSGQVYQYLPPQPPATLSWVTLCQPDQVRQFGQRLDFLRTVLDAADAPADELAAASLRQVAAATGSPGDSGPARRYLEAAGRELARLLSREPARLNGILQRMRP